MTYLVVVAPVKPEMVERARGLLAGGPPFDLESTPFHRHTVHMTDREVVFVFETEGDSAALQVFAEDPRIWEAAAAWQECFVERPRVARLAFAWERIETPSGVSFEPTPGPGDSDGGDLYTP